MLDENDSKSARDQRGAAVHEAGHVIVASALGLTVEYVEVGIGGDDAKGAAEIEYSSELSLVDRLAVCAAGLEAQRLFVAPTHNGAGWGDFAQMIKLVKDLSDEESSRARYDGYQRARGLLIRHAAKVELVAKLLLTKKRMLSSELRNRFQSDERRRMAFN
jgi:ATP-dependent Zn protease